MRKPGIPQPGSPRSHDATALRLQDTLSAVAPQNGPPYSNERCRSQSLSQVNHSIDPVPDHTSEVDAATKLLDKACQKLQASKTSIAEGH